MYGDKQYRKHASRRQIKWMTGLVLFVLSLFLFACSRPATPTLLAPAETPVVVNTLATVTPTTPPTPTTTPQPVALLVIPPGADQGQASELQSLLVDLATGAGLDFQTVSELSPSDLPPGLRVAVFLPPVPGLDGLAAAAPGASFIAVGVPDLPSAPNLIAVSSEAARADQQGFLAGYLASLVTPDWRIGVISTSDNPDGKSNRQGFLNGAVFYCGLCRPAYPPFVQYPLFSDLTSGASPADQQAAADSLIAQGVKTVYVAPGSGDASLFEYLAGQGVNLIGGEAPPAGVEAHWIATISSDWLEGVRQAWAQATAVSSIAPTNDGPSGPLAITHRNETLFSAGRQRLVEQIRDELASGLIDTGVDPATGNPR